ncbi:type II toxin-antitoxin system HipA family toxin [Pseudomonas sp. NFACC39-1]|uniref:type II toxin-antitoxin system HipA family toxin n=1 Tax=Pseudomonas sp. NFACC39-1 TaxID=1566195 RepID=UPI0008C96B61|nr:HipA domain-containing protein [Pseudomonas sp. NFACC39-1]SEN46875.1 serine/threonine-protein kinase HipA [Pseudomonas sp. NFACC39-1]
MLGHLTIQTYVDGHWHDAVVLTVSNAQKIDESRCSVSYDQDYLVNFIHKLESPFELAISVNLPLSWNAVDSKGYPPFVYDIIPAGAARKSLQKRFGGERPDGMDMSFFLLSRCTPSPIGHLRVKESFEHIDQTRKEAFARKEVVDRTNDFLEYAYESGAALGGATGAQGEAPKLIMVEGDDGALYADAMLSDDLARRHWLVKFARNQVTERDKNILRAEYHYYKAISQLGLNTISTDGLVLEEADKPSLWMPRFDRRVANGMVERVPVESIYSVCGNTEPGSRMNHEDVLNSLIQLWRKNGQDGELEELVFEYVRRDLLNRILGNSDNHGRNTAIFRYRDRFELAPIYDLAPMVLDPEGVTRVTKWQPEHKGSPDWRTICGSFHDVVNPDVLFERLLGAAETFRALPDLLVDLPEEVRRAQSIPINNLDKRLVEWGLR